MKDELKLIAVILLFAAPYAWLLYRAVNIRIRLMFACLAAILLLCLLATVGAYFDDGLIGVAYGDELIIGFTIPINIAIIFVSWMYEKLHTKTSTPGPAE